MKKRILVIMLGAMLALSGCGAAKENPEAEAAVSAEITEEKATESKDTQNDESKPAEEATKTEEAKDESKTETKEATDAAAKGDDKDVKTADSKTETKDSSAASDTDKTKTDNSEKKSDSTENVKASDSKAEDSKETKKEDSTKSEASPKTEETPAKTEEPAKAAPAKVDYGRILFIGDSRTVDMFSGDVERIYGEIHDGITVYAEDARDYSFLIEIMGSVGTENFDTLVSWMGANDYGNFGNYQPHYEGLLREGKRLILCTVGPTMDSALASDFDRTHYSNDLQIAYNNSLVAWANANGVQVIDLYSYLAGNTEITLDPADGIHYQPRPTGAIWGRIVSSFNR